MGDTRGCEHCGAAFEPRREHARFCSARCRVAWNREHRNDAKTEASALEWAIIGMCDASRRLDRVRARDRAQAFAVISEAVWWVTIVDATLVRYHPGVYDATLAAQPPAERERTERTFAGLRFVRNWMGYHADQADFIQPRGASQRLADARITAWTWKPLPRPPLSSLPPRGRSWERARYQAYQAQLAGYPIGETIGRATAFLLLAADRASSAGGGVAAGAAS
jgi:hypothetical protein